MAMLAEPRRKQRIGPNPRGLFFTEDDQNVGRTMLQKLGWKDGSGLGRTHQGISVPIKPKVQQNSNGLGFDVKENPWVAHSDKFAELLQNLNSTSDGGNATGVDRLELEKTSKSSKSRIHYQKFVRNKDLSKCSSKDWECIFGKSVDVVSSEKSGDKLVMEEPTEIQEGVTLEDKFLSGGSMLDYFKQKFEQKKKQNLCTEKMEFEVTDTEIVTNEVDREEMEFDVMEPVNKKSKGGEMEETEIEVTEPLKEKRSKKVKLEEIELDVKEPVRKKSKKVELDESDVTESAKKKKSKKVELEEINSDVTEPVKRKKSKKPESEEIEFEAAEPAKKKKSKKVEIEEIKFEVADPVKKKKTKKVEMEDIEIDAIESVKKKKSKKVKLEDDGNSEESLERKDDKLVPESIASKSEIIDEPNEIKESVTLKDKFVNGGSMVDYFKQKFEQKYKNAQTTNVSSNTIPSKIEVDCNSETTLKKKKNKSFCAEEIEFDATEPVKKEKSKKVKIKDDRNSEELEKKNKLETESSVCSPETLEGENFNGLRGRKNNLNEETVNKIASKYVGSNVLCIPGYPIKEIEIDPTEPVKKKKSKRVELKEMEIDATEPVKQEKIKEIENDSTEPVKKKKSKKVELEDTEIDSKELVKKKKSKKVELEEIEIDSTELVKKKKSKRVELEDTEIDATELVKKKKSKKVELEDTEIDATEPVIRKKSKKVELEEIKIDATEPVIKKKSKKVKIEDDGNSEESLEKNESKLEAESSVCIPETVEDESFNEMRGRKRIWDEETVKIIASKYVGSNVLCIPGYPI